MNITEHRLYRFIDVPIPVKKKKIKPGFKSIHAELIKNETAIFNPYNEIFSNKKYRTNLLEKIAIKTSRIYRVPINNLLNMYSELPGSSDEPDNSRKFKRRVKGLNLAVYFSGKYPPILILKRGNRRDVINGRHRTINFINELERNCISINSPKAKIRARIINLDNPAVVNLLKRAQDQGGDYSVR